MLSARCALSFSSELTDDSLASRLCDEVNVSCDRDEKVRVAGASNDDPGGSETRRCCAGDGMGDRPDHTVTSSSLGSDSEMARAAASKFT